MSLSILGIDYAWGTPPYDRIKQDGYRFVMRYVSHDPGKDLKPTEKTALFKRGIQVGIVFESTAGRARGGHPLGVADATHANGRVKSLGLAGIPIYFAVDFDANGPDVEAYIRGAASVIGHDRTGVYAGYRPVAHLHSQNACKWFWQTYAWSAGRVHPSTHVYQYHNGAIVGGLSCDLNRASVEGMRSLRGPGFKPPKPHKYGSRILKFGDQGEDVRDFQRYLTKTTDPFISIDGDYGPQTEKAKHNAMYKLGWPSYLIKRRDKSKSIGKPGLGYIKSPRTRPDDFKKRSKTRVK